MHPQLLIIAWCKGIHTPNTILYTRYVQVSDNLSVDYYELCICPCEAKEGGGYIPRDSDGGLTDHTIYSAF